MMMCVGLLARLQKTVLATRVSLMLSLAVFLAVSMMLSLLLMTCAEHPFHHIKSCPVGSVESPEDLTGVSKVDILFVVDNSGSMAGEQLNLARNFAVFIDELSSTESVVQDYQMAVITTDMLGGNFTGDGGTAGRFFSRSDYPKIITSDMTRDDQILYFSGPQTDVHDGNAEPGAATAGLWGYEMGLESFRAALTAGGINPERDTFLREGAALAILFLTDEEDCSADTDAANATDDLNRGAACYTYPSPPVIFPVQEYIDFVLALKDGDASLIKVGLITGADVSGQASDCQLYCGTDSNDWPQDCTASNAALAGTSTSCAVTYTVEDNQGDPVEGQPCSLDDVQPGNKYPGTDADCCTARSGSRYIDFANSFESRIVTICQNSFAEPMLEMAELISCQRSIVVDPEPANPEWLTIEITNDAGEWVDLYDKRVAECVPDDVDGWMFDEGTNTIRICNGLAEFKCEGERLNISYIIHVGDSPDCE